jgi:hypothetical protein
MDWMKPQVKPPKAGEPLRLDDLEAAVVLLTVEQVPEFVGPRECDDVLESR